MAGRLGKDNQNVEEFSSKWTNLVDCGGLFHVTNVVYNLFVSIDKIVNEKLDSILTTVTDLNK